MSMSKQVMRSNNDSMGRSRKTSQSYQPVWMAHWMRTSSNAAEGRDVGASGHKELDHVSEAPRSVKGSGKAEATRESLRLTSKGFGNFGICSTQMEQGEDGGDTQTIRFQFSSGVIAEKEKSSKEYHSSIGGTSNKSLDMAKTHFSAKERSSSNSMPSQERFVGASTHMMPYHDLERYNKGKAVMCQPTSRPSIVFNDQLPDTKLKIRGRQDDRKYFQLGNSSEPDTSFTPCLGDHNTSLLLDAPSIHDQPKSGQDWLQKMQKFSHVISLFPSQSSEKIVQKVPCYDRYPLQKFSSCVHETTRICTTVDSVEAPPSSYPWFSQTTHSLLITKKTDVNVSKETDVFRRLITQMNRNSSTDLEYVPPFSGQANGGVTLQPISSSNSEGQENIGDKGIETSKCASRNESSAETDIMDMDFSKVERLNIGENSTRSNKVFNFDNNLSPQINVASSREVGCRWTSSGLPEINLELPALPAGTNSSEDVPTSSRTQSLEMDMLLAQAEQPDPKSTPSLDDCLRADPTTRWVKRLRLSSSDSSARGTKSLKLDEKSSHDKKREFFKGITREQHGIETLSSDRSGNLSKEDEGVPLNQPKKSKELLSHVWIKRWLRDGSQISQRKPETVVICEPQSLKPAVDDEVQKKQFPSIAAMALMGRSMTGLQSCELQKRGPFTIWSTSTL